MSALFIDPLQQYFKQGFDARNSSVPFMMALMIKNMTSTRSCCAACRMAA